MSLKRKAISGTFWTAGSSAVMALIQILRLSILTRFLEKSDFGLVAIVILVLGFTHLFADLGVSVSLFSRQNISKKEYSSLYWISLILGVLLYFLLVGAAPSIASFYKQPALEQLIPVMGLDLIITTAGRQFRIFRQKALAFKNLALIDILAVTLSLGVAVIIAMKGGGVWSIVYSTLFATSFASLLLIVTGLRTHPLMFYINLKEGRSFYKIGLYQTGSQILDYIASQLDILIIGKLMNTSDLGVYNLIKQLVSRVYTVINPIITKVAIPVLATVQDQLEVLKAKYLQMISMVSFVNMGIYALLAILAKEVLLIIYGPTYQDAEMLFQILCIWGALNAVGNVAGTIVIIKGRTDLGFRWTVLRILSNPIFVIVGSYWGLFGIVIGQALYSFLFFSVYWKILIYKVLSIITFKQYVLTTLTKFIVSISLFIVLFIIKFLLLDKMNNIILNISVLSLVFCTAYMYLNKESLIIFIDLIRKDKGKA